MHRKCLFFYAHSYLSEMGILYKRRWTVIIDSVWGVVSGYRLGAVSTALHISALNIELNTLFWR